GIAREIKLRGRSRSAAVDHELRAIVVLVPDHRTRDQQSNRGHCGISACVAGYATSRAARKNPGLTADCVVARDVHTVDFAAYDDRGEGRAYRGAAIVRHHDAFRSVP